jgi:hypothetical protein
LECGDWKENSQRSIGGSEELIGERRWASYFWTILLFLTACLLLIYREPKGAYVKEGTHHDSKL